MAHKMEDWRYWLVAGAAFVLAFGLYCVGVKFVLPLLILSVSFWYVPVPGQLDSILGRAVSAVILNIVLLQIAAVVQFFVWPNSNFLYVAELYAFFGAIVVYVFGRSAVKRPVVFTRYDAAGLVIAALFVLPFAPIVVGHDTVQRIVSIAGLQSPDAGHHFDFIGSMMSAQHLDTSGYPKSFHLGVGFLQSAFVGTQDSLSWSANVMTFFAQYLLFGTLLAVLLGYVCMFWFERLLGRVPSKWASGAASIALALPLVLVIMWPFVEHGFLNYLYLISVLALTVMFGDDLLHQKKRDEAVLAMVLLLLLGASLTWPLVVPAVLFGLLLLLWPIRFKNIGPMIRHHKTATLLVAMQLVPLGMQVSQPGTTSINDEGDLRTLAIFVLLAGALVAIIAVKKLPAASRKTLTGLLVPFGFLAGGILLMQLFLFGEPRYFSIKVALLLEAFMLPLAVALLFAWAGRRKMHMSVIGLFVFIPLAVSLALLVASGKPLEDVRNLFRDRSGQEKPAFYDHDVFEYATLGKQGKINYFNSTVLHYNADNKTLYSHPFLPQIAQYMKYARTPGGLEAYACHRLIFKNIAGGDFSALAQQDLVALVRDCAFDAQLNGQKYYIITDEASLQKVKAEIGEGRGIVYVGS